MVCERILKKVGAIKKIDGHEVQISSSIGVVLLKSPTITAHINIEKILRAADEQMYKAKKSGKSRIEYSVFVPEIRKSA
jgi:GGDEF domain-containing protein